MLLKQWRECSSRGGILVASLCGEEWCMSQARLT